MSITAEICGGGGRGCEFFFKMFLEGGGLEETRFLFDAACSLLVLKGWCREMVGGREGKRERKDN